MKKSSKKTPKKVISMVLASSMIVSMSGYSAFAAEYSDIYGHWAKTQIDRWSDYGVISGSDGQFRPDDSITRGEMAVIIDRVMKYQVKAENTFKDLGQAFYTDPILKANNAGVMSGSDGLVRPTDKITREEAAVLMCKAFNLEPTEVTNKKFSDSDKISAWAKGYVNALLNENYITGKGNNDFDPQGKITRGEAVTMINNIVKGFYNATGTYTENTQGTVVINTPNANLKDMSISGDLIIAEGVGEGDLTLDNVKVAGNVIVRGGGVNSIHIIGDSKIGNVIIAKRDGNVSVKTSDGASVEFIYVEDGSKDVFLSGTFGNVEVNASNVTVTAKGATMINANVNKPSSTLVVDKDSKVNVATIAETAANSKVIVEGEVKNAIVNAPSATLTGEKGSKIDTVKVNETAVNAKINLDGTTKSVAVAAEGTNVTVNKDAKVDSITIAKSATDAKVDVKGTVTTIKTDAPNTNITVSGKVDKIDASESAKGTTIIAEKGGYIKDVVSKAENTTVKGDGRVDNVQIGGNNSTVDTKGTNVKVDPGVDGTKAGGKDLNGGDTYKTPGTPDGGTNGGSGGSGSSGNGSDDRNDGNNTGGSTDEGLVGQKAPTGLIGYGVTKYGNDGRITGTTTAMEYRLNTNSSYTTCTEPEINGLVAGTYHVRYKAKPGYLASKTAEVVVPGYQIPAVDQIVLDKTEYVLPEGKTVQLTATVTPDDALQTVTWTSSDTKLATVDENGLVQTLNGSAAKEITITATAVGGKTATCVIKPYAWGVSLKDVTIGETVAPALNNTNYVMVKSQGQTAYSLNFSTNNLGVTEAVYKLDSIKNGGTEVTTITGTVPIVLDAKTKEVTYNPDGTGTFSIPMLASTADVADYNYTITVGDATIAVGEASGKFKVTIEEEPTKPTVTNTSANKILATNVSAYEVKGTCDGGLIGMEVLLKDSTGKEVTQYVNLVEDNTTWTAKLDASTLADGNVTITARGKKFGGYGAYSDPVTVIKDAVAPIITGYSVVEDSITGSSAKVKFTSSKSGTYYYLTKLKSEASPSVDDIKTSGISGDVTAGQEKVVDVTDLATNTEYTTYIVVVDTNGNISEIAPTTFKTKAEAAPSIAVKDYTFDKKVSLQKDILVTVDLGLETLAATDITSVAVKNGAALVRDTDYTFEKPTLTIKKDYLATLAEGSHTFTVTFNDTANTAVDINVVVMKTAPIYSATLMINTDDASGMTTDVYFKIDGTNSDDESFDDTGYSLLFEKDGEYNFIDHRQNKEIINVVGVAASDLKTWDCYYISKTLEGDGLIAGAKINVRNAAAALALSKAEGSYNKVTLE